MQLDKVKVPAGTFRFEFQYVDQDSHGVWLVARAGAPWIAPHGEGILAVDALALISPANPFVAWWVADRDDPRLQIDISARPERTRCGWEYRDLELDLVRHEPDRIELQDDDEFSLACRKGWITPEDAAMAEATAARMEQALERRTEPWGDDGWRRLDACIDPSTRRCG